MTRATSLVPVEKTLVIPGRNGMETWAAKSDDGLWAFERQEMPGTPWAVIHIPTGIVVDPCVGTLRDCRAYVASGGAQEDLELIQAHERNEHNAERSRSCPRC